MSSGSYTFHGISYSTVITKPPAQRGPSERWWKLHDLYKGQRGTVFSTEKAIKWVSKLQRTHVPILGAMTSDNKASEAVLRPLSRLGVVIPIGCVPADLFVSDQMAALCLLDSADNRRSLGCDLLSHATLCLRLSLDKADHENAAAALASVASPVHDAGGKTRTRSTVPDSPDRQPAPPKRALLFAAEPPTIGEDRPSTGSPFGIVEDGYVVFKCNESVRIDQIEERVRNSGMIIQPIRRSNRRWIISFSPAIPSPLEKSVVDIALLFSAKTGDHPSIVESNADAQNKHDESEEELPQMTVPAGDIELRRDGNNIYYYCCSTANTSKATALLQFMPGQLEIKDIPLPLQQSPELVALLKDQPRLLRTHKLEKRVDPRKYLICDMSTLCGVFDHITRNPFCSCRRKCPYSFHLQTEGFGGIVVANATCGACPSYSLDLSKRVQVETGKGGNQAGRLAVNFEFALAADTNCSAIGRLNHLFCCFGLGKPPRLNKDERKALNTATHMEYASEVEMQLNVFALLPPDERNLSADGVWGRSERKGTTLGRSPNNTATVVLCATQSLLLVESTSNSTSRSVQPYSTVALVGTTKTSSSLLQELLDQSLENNSAEEEMDSSFSVDSLALSSDSLQGSDNEIEAHDQDDKESVTTTVIGADESMTSVDVALKLMKDVSCLEKQSGIKAMAAIVPRISSLGTYINCMAVDGTTGFKKGIETTASELCGMWGFPVPRYVHDPFHLIKTSTKAFGTVAGRREGKNRPLVLLRMPSVGSYFKDYLKSRVLAVITGYIPFSSLC